MTQIGGLVREGDSNNSLETTFAAELRVYARRATVKNTAIARTSHLVVNCYFQPPIAIAAAFAIAVFVAELPALP